MEKASMKTIVHILNTGTYSGAESVVIQIINKMNQLYPGEYRFIYMSKNGMIAEVLEKAGIEYYPVENLSLKSIKKMEKLYQPDIIHAHDFTASLLAGLTKKEKVISHLHCNPIWIQNWNWKTILYWLSLRRYAKVITVSEAVCDEFVCKKAVEKKTIVLGNPVDINNIKQKAGKLQKKEYDLVFLGRLSEEKDPLRFIEIVKKIAEKKKDIKAVLIGDGVLREACEKQIREYGLDAQIKMTGFLTNPYTYIQESKVMCVTSKWEGFGLMAIEGLALGVPVVTVCEGGIKSIVNEECGKFCKDNEEMKKEIENLLEDEGYYTEKEMGARKRAAELDNSFSYMKQLRTIYQNL